MYVIKSDFDNLTRERDKFKSDLQVNFSRSILFIFNIKHHNNEWQDAYQRTTRLAIQIDEQIIQQENEAAAQQKVVKILIIAQKSMLCKTVSAGLLFNQFLPRVGAGGGSKLSTKEN